MIGENHYLIFGGLVCKGQYHKTNVAKNLGILLYTNSTRYHIDLLLNQFGYILIETSIQLLIYDLFHYLILRH